MGLSAEAVLRRRPRGCPPGESGRSGLIKVYEFLPRDAFLGIADEAKKQGLAFAGHVPQLLSVTEASDAGMKSMEHSKGIVQESSGGEREIRDLAGAKLELENVLKHLKADHTWQTPTLIQAHAPVADPVELRSDPRLIYIRTDLEGRVDRATGCPEQRSRSGEPRQVLPVAWAAKRSIEAMSGSAPRRTQRFPRAMLSCGWHGNSGRRDDG